jgi:hypothetical protein
VTLRRDENNDEEMKILKRMRRTTTHDFDRTKKCLTFPLNTPKLTVCPAQFLTSVAKSAGSGLS